MVDYMKLKIAPKVFQNNKFNEINQGWNNVTVKRMLERNNSWPVEVWIKIRKF